MFKIISKQTGSAHAIIISILALGIIGALGFVYWNNYINKKSVSTNNVGGTTSQKTSKSNNATVLQSSQTLASIKEFIDSKKYADVSQVSTSTRNMIWTDGSYSTLISSSAYALKYSGVLDSYSSARDIYALFPTLNNVYSDLRQFFISKGYSIDDNNTYNNLEKTDSSNSMSGQQIGVRNSVGYCEVSDVFPLSFAIGTTSEFTMYVSCAPVEDYASAKSEQAPLIDALYSHDSSVSKSDRIVSVVKHVGNFIKASVSSRGSIYGGNSAIFELSSGMWKFVAYNGQAYPSCKDVDDINIPAEIQSQCINTNNTLRSPR